MGNCQAIDAAALVIQLPCGKTERFYWPIPVNEVMRMNPGHYVSLIIPLPAASSDQDDNEDDKAVRLSRVKLLRPTDTLTLGHAYRLVTSQEVMEVLKAKRHAKTERQHQHQQQHMESNDKLQQQQHQQGNQTSHTHHSQVVTKNERRRPRTTPAATNTAAMSSKSWRPSLQSISESAS